LLLGDHPHSVVTLEVDQAGKILRIFFINNPDKLTSVSR
jgi:hypothetical protein